MNIEATVTTILCEQLDLKPEDIRPEANLVKDLGADSLDTVELVMAFEEEFGFEIADEDAEKIITVGDFIDYLKKKTAT